LLSLAQRMHERLDRDGLSIAHRAMENYASLPRHAKFVIDIFAVEEFPHELHQFCLHLGIQDYVLPVGFLYFVIQLAVRCPVIIVDIDVTIVWLLPLPNRVDQTIRNARLRHGGLTLSRLFQYVLERVVSYLDHVDDEILGAPLILVFCKAPRLSKLVRYATTVIPAKEIAKTLHRLGRSIQFCHRIAKGCELKEIDVGGNANSNAKPENDKRRGPNASLGRC